MNKQTKQSRPTPLGTRFGFKVAWEYYATESDALAASRIATVEAERREALGYEFGWQCPGSIRKVERLGEQVWEVCIP